MPIKTETSFSTALFELEGNPIKQLIMKLSITQVPLKHLRKTSSSMRLNLLSKIETFESKIKNLSQSFSRVR